MNKIICILTLISLVLLSACVEYEESQDKQVQGGVLDELTVYTRCSDGVVCYWHQGYKAGGMDCFRNEVLITKYC